MTAESFIVAAFVAGMALLLVTLAAVLRVLEWAFPAFSDWLDEHVGPEGPWA